MPHIDGNSLQEIAFGTGYAYARDNICLLADQIVKYTSRRARHFGPDQDAEGDNLNLISDFSYLALGIRAQAEARLASLSENSRALLSGYASGYNLYLQETGLANLDAQCAGQDWVQPLTSTDLLTMSLGIALLPGSANFLAPIFRAAPPGAAYEPTVATSVPTATRQPATAVAQAEHAQRTPAASRSTAPDHRLAAWTWQPPRGDQPFGVARRESSPLASNGWALGGQKTANGRGMVLANPHFPHTGNLRFWQFHVTIPTHLNVMGASLAGMPGVVNIGFNDNVAWTHTYSTAEHVIVYELALDPSDPSGLTWLRDGQPRPIESRQLSIEVKLDNGNLATLEKTVYDSELGPMILVPDALPGDAERAFTLADANRENLDVIDHWLAMNLAGSLDEFKQSFTDYDGVVFNNTLAADRSGKAYYVDDSTVPDLPPAALDLLSNDATVIATRAEAGFTILPASTATVFSAPIPAAEAPSLQRNDFVQNSNDSFWLTNPAAPITGVSPLYGATGTAQSLRSRLAQRFLESGDSAAGDNGKFTLDELEGVLFNQRTFLGEAVLEDLVERCQVRGSNPVSGVNIAPGCAALAQWDGKMIKDRVGALVFREFAEQFARLDAEDQWLTAFDPDDPLDTPHTLSSSPAILEAFAAALAKIDEAGLEVDATLGEVQFVERSTVNGAADGNRLAWSGANDIEGGFNVFAAEEENDGTLLPRHVYPSLDDTQLSTAGYHLTYGSSWMYVLSFTNSGPVARGLLAYSQSVDRQSPHFLDQTQIYANGPSLRPLRFTESDIASHTEEEKRLVLDLD